MVGVAAALLLLGAAASATAADQPNLNGIWTGSDGARVRLTQTGQSVTTTFLAGGPCPNASQRSYLIQGQLNGTSLQGQMLRCTSDLTLLEDCHLTDPWQTTFSATVSQDSISGTYRSQYYTWDNIVNGHRVNCRRDPSGDSDSSFELTRARCDPNLFNRYKDESAQASALFDAVDGKVSEAKYRLQGFLIEQAAESAEIGTVKGGLVVALKRYGGKAGKIVVKAAEVAALVYTAYWLAHDVQPEIQEEILMLQEAQDQLGIAEKRADMALADLKKFIAEHEECKDDPAVQATVSAEDQFNDQVQAKLDAWELPGGYLYRDPSDPSGVPMDASAAFKRAASLLSGGKQRLLQTYARTAEPAKKQPKGKTYRVSKPNVKAAIKRIDRGLSDLRRLRAWALKRVAADDAVDGQLQVIVQHLANVEVG
jgi:hypothetical protein